MRVRVRVSTLIYVSDTHTHTHDSPDILMFSCCVFCFSLFPSFSVELCIHKNDTKLCMFVVWFVSVPFRRLVFRVCVFVNSSWFWNDRRTVECKKRNLFSSSEQSKAFFVDIRLLLIVYYIIIIYWKCIFIIYNQTEKINNNNKRNWTKRNSQNMTDWNS